jgi:four helix bundle protein
MADFKNLVVWQKAQSLAMDVLRVSKDMRGTGATSFKSQLVRAAFSIPANIAEGRSQQSEREFGRFLKIALNSSTELEYHLITCRDLGMIRHSIAGPLLDRTIEVRRMLYGLLRKVNAPSSSSKLSAS